MFDDAEEVADGLVVAGHTELEEVAALLDQFHLRETLRQEQRAREPVLHRVNIIDEVDDSDCVGLDSGARQRLKLEIRADTAFLNLLKNHFVYSSLGCDIHGLIKGDSLVDVFIETLCYGDLCQLVESRLFDLDFTFIACAIFVLDVLRATIALEDTSTHHDAHLGGQGLSLLHRVGRQDASRVLASLCNALDNGPHEAASLRVHTGRRLIQQNNWWVSDQCHCDRKLTLISTGQGSSWLIPVIRQIQFLDRALDNLLLH